MEAPDNLHATSQGTITAAAHYRRVRLCVLAMAVVAFPLGLGLGVVGTLRNVEASRVASGPVKSEALAVASRALDREHEQQRRRMACEASLGSLQAELRTIKAELVTLRARGKGEAL